MENSELHIQKAPEFLGKPCTTGKYQGLLGTSKQTLLEDVNFWNTHPHILEPMMCTVRNSFAVHAVKTSEILGEKQTIDASQECICIMSIREAS